MNTMNSYLDVFIGDYSCNAVLTELARCMSLFPNLHTIQIDAPYGSRRSWGKTFDRSFKGYSYPQIRNVFVMFSSQSLLASCPEARHVGSQQCLLFKTCIQLLIDNCPHLEVLESFEVWGPDAYKCMIL